MKTLRKLRGNKRQTLGLQHETARTRISFDRCAPVNTAFAAHLGRSAGAAEGQSSCVAGLLRAWTVSLEMPATERNGALYYSLKPPRRAFSTVPD